MLADERADHEKLRDLYLTAFSREPTKEEYETLLSYLAARASDRRGAYGDILWALLNTKEFLHNH